MNKKDFGFKYMKDGDKNFSESVYINFQFSEIHTNFRYKQTYNLKQLQVVIECKTCSFPLI